MSCVGVARVRVLTFKADDKIIEMLDELVRKTGRSRSEIIRAAIMRYYRNFEDELRNNSGITIRKLTVY